MSRTLRESFSIRLAGIRRSIETSRPLKTLGVRGTGTLFLATALSVGGVAEVIGNTHFSVEKNLDSVRVVKRTGGDEKIVADIKDGFTGASVFKIARVFPDSLVSRELSLFDSAWMPEQEKQRSEFREELARINDAIRREFFASAVPYGELIHEKAEKYDVDPALVAAVVEAESRFKRRAKSPVGAKGLMQLMPRTGRWMGARDLYDPEQNVDAGVKYIKYLDKRFNGNLKKTIAAYNAGEGNVKRYGGVPPFRETQTYVKKVMKNYDKRTRELKAWEEEQRSAGALAPEKTEAEAR